MKQWSGTANRKLSKGKPRSGQKVPRSHGEAVSFFPCLAHSSVEYISLFSINASDTSTQSFFMSLKEPDSTSRFFKIIAIDLMISVSSYLL